MIVVDVVVLFDVIGLVVWLLSIVRSGIVYIGVLGFRRQYDLDRLLSDRSKVLDIT